jgi:DNA-directed RNA polymerase subunit RPC12/RpoP
MGLLGKLLKKPAETPLPAWPVCSHRILIARWDNIEDMGHDERATGYKCETCDELFTPEAGRELMNMA